MDTCVLLLLVLIPVTLSSPVESQWQTDGDTCSTRCPDRSTYRYATGTTYHYRYEAETRTTMTGAAEDTATITISAFAIIAVLGPCDMALSLTDVVVKRSHEDNPARMVFPGDMSRARRSLERQSLRFAFHDGLVADLCPDTDEDLWALNMKRGVLTSFQNSMRHLDREEHVLETDVTGRCPTHYQVTQKGWKSQTVTKTKDVLSCTDRNDYRTSILTVPYTTPTSLQSLPLMKSSHECQHEIDINEGILRSSSCHEVHVFRPFSKASSGAATETSQKLTFVSKATERHAKYGAVSRRTTLLFEHKQGLDRGKAVLAHIKDKLQELCDVTKIDIRPQVPLIFGQMVHQMRSLDYSDLKDLERQLQRKAFCPDNAEKTRKFFLDALPMAATGAALRVMADLLISSEVKDTQATFWLTSLAFVPNPTKDMLAAVKPLLSTNKTQADSMLAVSSMVNNYCEEHAQCDQDSDVQDIISQLTHIIASDCQVNDNNLRQVLLVLRAIGNIGPSETTWLRLQPCFTNAQLPMDVRVAAVDALRRMPCSADRTTVMATFRRESEDTELRIGAYLAVMKCPSQWVIDQVREALQAEKVNQVGSFVWTHLTNLVETDSPHKQAIRDVLENGVLHKQFNMDRRKFSRNYELSFFSDKFNLGGTYENNIIWSAGSFVPRSAMVNLTVEVFGRSVNLLEVGGRMQGLEHLLYTYLGPTSSNSGKDGGYGSTDIVSQEKLTSTRQKFGQVRDELRAQLYVRVMGNELAYRMLDSSDVEKLKDGKASAFRDDVLNNLLKGGQVSFTQSVMFLDSTLIIPTALGLPLNLTVNGSTSVDLKATHNMDVKKLFANSQAFEVEATLNPSAAVEIVGLMSVDAFVTQVGLKMSSQIHTSTAVKARVELARGQIFSVELDMPRDSQELFSYLSKFYIVHDSYEKEQKMIVANRHENRACSGEGVSRVLGLELCTVLSFPNATTALTAPYFPFTGPSSLAITLTKQDVHSGYRLLAKQIQTGSSLITQMALDTPGSKVDRAVSLGFVANIKAKTLEAELLSPWKKAAAKVAISNSKSQYNTDGSVTIDGDQVYTVTAKMDKSVKEEKDVMVKLKPSLLITGPKGVMMSLSGGLDYKKGKQLSTNAFLEMKDILEKPISINYEETRRQHKDKMRYKNSFKLSSQFVSVKSSLQAVVGAFNGNRNSASLTVSSKVDYNIHAFPTIRRNLVDLGLKINDRSTNAISRYDISLNVDAKRTPEYNLMVNGQVSHKKTLMELEIKVRHGEDVKVKVDKDKELLVVGFVSHNVKSPKAAVRFELKAVYPDKLWEYEILGKHDHNDSTAEEYITVRYAKGKSVDVHLLLDQKKDKKRHATFDLSYPAGYNYPARDVKINADYIEKNPTHHVVTALVSLQKGEKNSIVLSVQRPTPDSVDISGELGLHDHLPITLEAGGNLALRDMKGRGQMTYEGQKYSIHYTSDIRLTHFANFTLDLSHPERHVTARLEGGSFDEEGVKRVKSLVMWDADRDQSQKAGLTVEVAHAVEKDDINVGGTAELFMPVEGYQHLKGQLQFEKSSKRILAVAETVLGEDEKTYSVKFQVKLPITSNSISTVLWLKTPHIALRHLEAGVNHSFEESAGHMSTALRGVFNEYLLEVGISGGSKGNMIVRLLEGIAFFRSSFPGAENWRLSFNHRDTSGRYTSQALLHANGDQYSADLQANFNKVHWQVRTDGTVTIRAPQLSSEVRAVWHHTNSLHDVKSSLTLNITQGRQIYLEIAGTANIVANTYEAIAKLRGPWHQDGSDYSSEMQVHHEMSPKSSYDTVVKLKLEQDTYDIKHLYTLSGGLHTIKTSLTMSKYPQFSFTFQSTTRYETSPYVASMELRVVDKPLFIWNVEVDKTGRDQYRSNSRLVLYLEDSVETVTAAANHERNKTGQWVSTGNLQMEAGKLVTFENVLDFQRDDKKMVNLKLDTPYNDMRSLRLEYSHSGNIQQDFSFTTSIAVEPIFDTVSASLSWSNKEKFLGSMRIDTPFSELPYLEFKCHSFNRSNVRHSTIYMDMAPGQIYELRSVYSVDWPRAIDLDVNITTPMPELPMMHTQVAYQFTDDEVSGRFKLIGTKFEELSTDFGHRRGPKMMSSRLDAVMRPDRRWSGRADLSWQNEIDGTVSLETVGSEPWQLILSHKGHTWHDFKTKAGFRMNNDKLESELAYSDKNGHSGLFMLVTPDPDIDFFKATFYQKQTEVSFEGRYATQYGDKSKPYELGLSTTFSDDKIAFGTDFKTPYTEDLNLELGFSGNKRVEMKLLGLYGSDNKIDTLIKYSVKKESWDVAAEFEYRIKGDSRDIGLTFKRDGPLDSIQCQATGKYMGKRVGVDMQLKQSNKTLGRVDVRTNFHNYTDLSLTFDHSGDDENFQTNVYMRWQDKKEVRSSLDVQRTKWRRVVLTATLDLPIKDYNNNKLTYKHNSRKNKFSADATLQLGKTLSVSSDLEFLDNSKLTVTINGPFMDFQSCVATGTWSEADLILDGQATVTLLGQRDPMRARYTVNATNWPIGLLVNIQATTPFQGWSLVQINATHDVIITDFTTSVSLTAEAIGTLNSEIMFNFTSPTVFDGRWTMTSTIEGAKDLRLSIKNSESGSDQYHQRLIVGWDLFKEIVLDTSLQIGDELNSDKRFKTAFNLMTPWSQAKQVSILLDHRHNEESSMDNAVASYNDKTWLDADFKYFKTERHVGSLQFRQPRPMEYLLTGRYSPQSIEGEVKANLDKRDPDMNVHLSGEYTDMSDSTGTDNNIKVWVVHPARTMGLEYLMKKAVKEFHTDFLLTWDKTQGQTVAYVVQWTDRSSRFSSAYDALFKVGVPMRSVQLEGAYSDTGRAQAVQGAILWDADRAKDMKLGVKGQLDKRGPTNKMQLGFDLPFLDKEYSVTTETAVNALLDTRTEFSYSKDPRKLLVLTTRLHDLSYSADTTNYNLTFGLVHPATDVNVTLTSHISSSSVLCSLATQLEYLTAQREQKTMQIHSSYDRQNKNMILELQTPIKAVSIEAGVTTDHGNYNLHLTSKEDGQMSQLTDLFINPVARTIELAFRYDKESPVKSLNMVGNLVTDQLLQAELYSLDNGQRVSETLLTVRLNTSHVLHTRLNWRPSMLTDLKTYLGTQLTVFSYSSSEALRFAANAVGEEVEAKYKIIMQETRAETGPLLQHLQEEMQELQSQLDITYRDLRRFYNKNALHVQDLGQLASEAIQTVIEGLQSLNAQYRLAYSQLQQDLQRVVQGWGHYPMAQKYAAIVHDLTSGLQNSRQVLEHALNQLILHVTELSDTSYEQYQIISRQINRKLQGYMTALRSTAQYQSLARVYGNAQSTLTQLSQGHYQQLVDAANVKMLAALDRLGLKESYITIVSKSKQLISDQFHDLMQRSEFQQIYIVGTEIYQQTVWAYQYWHVEHNMQLAMHQLIELARDVTLLEITRIKNAIVDLDKSRIIIFDPQNGEMQFEVYMPVSMKSLAEAPDLRLNKYINRIRSWTATYIPTPRHSFWTYLNKYLPSTDSDMWILPFSGYGYVMGDQHVVTFDGKHYNFAGRCSYILARDMLDDHFAVVLDFNNRARQPQVQSLLVLLRGVAIELGRDNKVKVNGQETELPFTSGFIKAVRDRSIIRVQDASALTVEMDNLREIYSVSVSGWYHGRTAGLLGTYDNEPYNDMTAAEGGITKDLEVLGNSWEVGRRNCRSRNLASTPDSMDSQDANMAACQQFLNQSSSYYAPCYDWVDADEMVSVCVEYVRSGDSVQKAQCKTGQQYRYMCHRKGIVLGTPPNCVTCQLWDGQTLTSGNSAQANTSSGSRPLPSADVVMVVEDSVCNAWARRSLSDLATQLSLALTAQGLLSNRLGLISYYGNGSDEVQLTHTIEGELFGEPSSFLKATESLRLDQVTSGSSVEAALQVAVNYPFRVGVAKLLVLLPCSLCTGDLTSLTYTLRSQGFVLHVINRQQFQLQQNDASLGTVRIFGLDNSGVYTQKSAARQSVAIFKQLRMPSDACGQMAMATNGSVFDVNHMSESGHIQNEFFESFAVRGAVSAKPPSCQVCRCKDDTTGQGYTECRSCDNNSWLWDKFSYWLQSPSSVIGIFNDLHFRIYEGLVE